MTDLDVYTLFMQYNTGMYFCPIPLTMIIVINEVVNAAFAF